jgi:hypothetical protein
MKYSVRILYRIQIRRNHPKFGHRKLIIHLLKNNIPIKSLCINLPWKAKIREVTQGTVILKGKQFKISKGE